VTGEGGGVVKFLETEGAAHGRVENNFGSNILVETGQVLTESDSGVKGLVTEATEEGLGCSG
jgi:hypothetical protein